jgi:hypothetical protein
MQKRTKTTRKQPGKRTRKPLHVGDLAGIGGAAKAHAIPLTTLRSAIERGEIATVELVDETRLVRMADVAIWKATDRRSGPKTKK